MYVNVSHFSVRLNNPSWPCYIPHNGTHLSFSVDEVSVEM